MTPAGTQKRHTEGLTVRRKQMVNPEGLSTQAELAEDEFARFFECSLDLLCVAGLDGYFKRLNPAWTSRLGWALEELVARPFLDFVHPDDREATTGEVSKLAAGAPTILFENRYRHQDGSYHWLQWNARMPGRELVYATARDITRQKWLEREILKIADREKEHLGRELHDGLCQSLSGIAALSTTLSRRLVANSESTASAEAAEIANLLNETIGQARDLARGLSPIGLNEAPLADTLETLALNVGHLFRVSCTLECDKPFSRLHHGAEAHLFRIAQEAVSNSITHGRADRIEISLTCNDGKGLLSVRDNGIGLPEGASNRDGIGLHTMDYRARLIGGSLKVQRRTQRGTTVTCAFPLPETLDTRESPNHVRNNT